MMPEPRQLSSFELAIESRRKEKCITIKTESISTARMKSLLPELRLDLKYHQQKAEELKETIGRIGAA
ncbi:MAG TPA: hypothetical protein VN455_06605 [Methanotrichaceae archaeon]|nr:hypothetical protein [Methanotrichaceae archaeon]